MMYWTYIPLKSFNNFSKSSVQNKVEPSSSIQRKHSIQEQFEEQYQRVAPKRTNFTHFPKEEDFLGKRTKYIAGSQVMNTEVKVQVFKPKEIQLLKKQVKRPSTHLVCPPHQKEIFDSPLKEVNSQ